MKQRVMRRIPVLLAGIVVFAVLVTSTRTCERSSPQSFDECVVDDDCVLMPSVISCCGECDPRPPFHAVTGKALDALRMELDAMCEDSCGECDPPVCEPLPPECYASAACIDGRCVPLVYGCELWLACEP